VRTHQGSRRNGWEEVGPTIPFVVDAATYTGRPTTNSGRVTALVVPPVCRKDDCKTLFAGSAGGGIWVTDNALADVPKWHSSNSGIPTNAIGSLYFDPTDSKGRTIYAGTGEPNGSGDSEAGLGLYKSTNLGRTWSLVAGSRAVAKDRSIAAIAVDPADSKHIWIGTAVARHGSSSVNGGRFTPPGAAPVGLYESTDGGTSFHLAFSVTSDPVNPGTANGSDFFRGGVSNIQWDALSKRIYFSIFDYGLYRQNGAGFEQVFTTPCAGDPSCTIDARTEFALAPLPGGKLRIYLADWGCVQCSPDNFGVGVLYRTDDANRPATVLTDPSTTDNPGWRFLSDENPATPGFSSFNFCGGQCSYDMPVASPPGHPDEVWIGGQMQYDEIFTATPPSNGRAVQRSVDAGVHFTDMTNDTQSPPLGMHPDQHAMAFTKDGTVAFLGSDGGVVRTSGEYADASGQCAGRGISGADLADCQMWLKSIPTLVTSMNDELATLQFQSLSLNPNDPFHDVLAGTQDNGTWALGGKSNGNGKPAGTWFESVGGDGGQSGIDVGNDNMRIHSYFLPQHDVNFHGNDPLGWDWVSDPFFIDGEGLVSSFYPPVLTDPVVSGTIFDGLLHVWRTQDFGGDPTYLDTHCNEFFGDFIDVCGDWVKLGGAAGDLTAGGSADKGTGYVVALARAQSDHGTLWAATRRGRLFISENADAENPDDVTFKRLDTSTQPRRFISGIALDPKNPHHAFISFSGYNAYTPTTPGHVFEVRFDGTAATWRDLSYDLGDQPITSIALDARSGDLYAGTDFGVTRLKKGKRSWSSAGAGGLPPVAVYGLTIDPKSLVLYAATHGRGIWELNLSRREDD